MTMTARNTSSLYRKLLPVLGHDDTAAFLTATAELRPPPLTEGRHPEGHEGKLRELQVEVLRLRADLRFLTLELARLGQPSPAQWDTA